ncbi:myb/SANT-like DNA-binding domain-containing protein 1 [Conger conger]|uniref:myb/SANT-like DNA-binding domain-containing protein 1 n=1 Tax=Conger conger TaxID=82655 RepID=UPI002A5A48E9|nr:myb/SANT-like DNA-binding domain-containing protein 1 [Conger conger]
MAADESFSYIVPGQSEKHRRARNWTDGEMKGLVYVWEEYVTELKKAKRNAKIYEKMAKRFFDLTGEHRHREEIKMKITNMTFQYRQMKCLSSAGAPLPEWPFFKAIDKILSKAPDPGRQLGLELPQSGPSTSHTEASPSLPATSPTGLLPEYTGSSDEQERQDEAEGSETSGSLHSQESRSQPVPLKRRKVQRCGLKKKKLKIMEAMLQEQRKVSRAVEETCREVRRVMHQQNFLQVQSLQLQERMMNLLEKMISPPVQPAAWPHAGIKEPGHGQS